MKSWISFDYFGEANMLDMVMEYHLEETGSLWEVLTSSYPEVLLELIEEASGLDGQDYTNLIEQYFGTEVYDANIAELEETELIEEWISTFSLEEQMLYGSDRLGIHSPDKVLHCKHPVNYTPYLLTFQLAGSNTSRRLTGCSGILLNTSFSHAKCSTLFFLHVPIKEYNMVARWAAS